MQYTVDKGQLTIWCSTAQEYQQCLFQEDWSLMMASQHHHGCPGHITTTIEGPIEPCGCSCHRGPNGTPA